MNRIYNALFVLMVGGMTACTDNNDEWINSSDTAPIGLQVYTSDNTESRSISNETYFPADKVIGVAATDVNDMTYGFDGYDNVPYKATGTGTSQTWAATGDAIMVSNIPAKIYAYYPYDSSVKDLSSITLPPYTQTDYMYAVPVIGITAENPSCSLTMQHAMAAVRVNLTKGTYIGTGEWNSTILSSNAIALQGTLNAFNGQLGNFSGVGGNLTMNSSNDYYLSSTPKNIDILAIPTGQSDKITVTVTVDGKQYTTQTSAVTLLQGKVYTVDLTLNEYELSVKAVTVKPWSEITQNSSSADFGYQLKVTGNMEGIAVNTQIQDGKAIITCVPSDPRRIIKHPTVDGATINITDDYETNNMVIEVTDLTKDATLTFDGLETGMIVAKYLVEDITNPVQILSTLLSGTWRQNSVSIGCEGTYYPYTLNHTFSSTGEHIVRIKAYSTSLLNQLFYGCGNLLEIDFYNYRIKPTIMQQTFTYSNKLRKVDAEFLDTSQVGSFAGTFSDCHVLKEIKGLENWNTSSATDMSNMFKSCKILESIDVSSFDTSKVTYMNSMFDACYELEQIYGLDNFDTSNVTNMRAMFNGCGALTELDLSNFNTAKVTNMQQMLSGVCDVMTSLDVSSFDTSNVTNMQQMFGYNKNCTEIKFGARWNTSNVTNMSNMFRDATKLTKLNVSGWNTSKVTNIMEMFRNTAIEELDLSHFDVSNVETGHFLFLGSGKLKKLNVDGWKFTKLKRFSNMFESCISLAELNIKDWDTSAATDMGNMFRNCSSLTSLDLSSFDTSNVTYMGGMFGGCSKLTSLDISSFDTSKVTNMQQMFSVCGALPTFTFKNFDTTKVTTMKEMFYHCRLSDDVLNSLKFNMASCSDISWMFYNAFGIQNYNLSNWNIQPGTNMANMFNGTAGIKTITFKDNLEGCDVTDIFKGQTGQVTLSYNSAYDYSNIIAQLPTTWTAVPVNY